MTKNNDSNALPSDEVAVDKLSDEDLEATAGGKSIIGSVPQVTLRRVIDTSYADDEFIRRT